MGVTALRLLRLLSLLEMRSNLGRSNQVAPISPQQHCQRNSIPSGWLISDQMLAGNSRTLLRCLGQ